MNLPMVPELGGELAISHTDGRLAWELAAEISSVPDLLTRYGLTPVQLKAKLGDAMFRQAVREAKTLWKSDLNVQQRIRLKAAFLVEDSLLDLFLIVKDAGMAAGVKLEAFEKLMKTADLAPKSTKNEAPAAAGFKINIILGDTPAERVTINADPIESNEPAE